MASKAVTAASILGLFITVHVIQFKDNMILTKFATPKTGYFNYYDIKQTENKIPTRRFQR